MMFNEKELQELRDYLLKVDPNSRIYLGCDSQKYKKHGNWFARYTIVVVVHIDNCHGGKIFGFTQSERDYDKNFDKPRMRLMNEVYKVAAVYLELGDILEDREVEVHLDINPKKDTGSSCVIKEASGYILGMCGVEAKVKPEAFAASYAADAGVRGRFQLRETTDEKVA
jgi:predicted RNase H-related nuclease YkuK (DUF458 family)